MAYTRTQFIQRLMDERLRLQPDMRRARADETMRDVIDDGLRVWAHALAEEVYGVAIKFEVGVYMWKDRAPGSHTSGKIAAIKALRGVCTHMGLKEAKDAVESMADAPVDRLIIGVYEDENAANTVMGLLREAGFEGGIRSVS